MENDFLSGVHDSAVGPGPSDRWTDDLRDAAGSKRTREIEDWALFRSGVRPLVDKNIAGVNEKLSICLYLFLARAGPLDTII